MDRPIVINNFNFCPLIQSPILGMECIECEHIHNVEEEFFCLCDDDEDRDELSMKEIINVLLDLLEAGNTKINRDEIIRIITDM